MDLNSPITAAARRITRHSNNAPSVVTYYYDAEGNSVADGHTATAVILPGHKNSAEKITHRVAQDFVDAYAATGVPNIKSMNENREFLDDLEWERGRAEMDAAR